MKALSNCLKLYYNCPYIKLKSLLFLSQRCNMFNRNDHDAYLIMYGECSIAGQIVEICARIRVIALVTYRNCNPSMKDKRPFKTILIRMIIKSDDSYTTFLRIHAIVLINSFKLSHTKWILKKKQLLHL